MVDFGELTEFVVGVARRIAARIGGGREVAVGVVAVFSAHTQRLIGGHHPVQQVVFVARFVTARISRARAVAASVVAVDPVFPFRAMDFG